MTVYPFPLAARLTSAAARSEMSRFLNGMIAIDTAVGAGSGSAGSDAGRPDWAPLANVGEDSTAYYVDLEVPGIAPDRLELLCGDGTLTIRGDKPVRQFAGESRRHLDERCDGQFERRFKLPKDADMGSVEAGAHHGVLSVRIAKIPPVQPRRVTISQQDPANASVQSTGGQHAAANKRTDVTSN